MATNFRVNLFPYCTPNDHNDILKLIGLYHSDISDKSVNCTDTKVDDFAHLR